MPDDDMALKPIRSHIPLTPVGIEVFAAILHLVVAHAKNPNPVGDAQHHKYAADYIRAHQRTAMVERMHADAASATYAVAHHGQPRATQVRVAIGQPWRTALSIATPSGAWALIDLSTVDIAGP